MGRRVSQPPTTVAPERSMTVGPQGDPEYLIAELRTQLSWAIGFAELCQRYAPGLEDRAAELAQGSRELFRDVSRLILRQSAGD
jgi:hypothetical protein